MRKLLSIMALFVMSLLAISMVSATTSTLGSLTAADITVEINDKEVVSGRLAVERGEKLDIQVALDNSAGTVDAEGIEVVARLSGYEYSDHADLEDSTSLFDVRTGTTKFVNVELTVPSDMDQSENTLRILVLDRNSAPIVIEYALDVESARHLIDIKDVAFSPGNTVKAGYALLTTVLVENLGQDVEDDVKVTVSIPALGVSATKYISQIDPDESEDASASTEEFFLPIPAATAAGEYDVQVTASYDDYETATYTQKIRVTANALFTEDNGKLVLAVGPAKQTVAAGKTATYGIALSNEGRSSKAYTLSAMTGGDWASASLSDALVVLEAGKSKVVYVDFTVAADAPVGEHVASVEVKSGEDVLETVAFSTNVVAGTQTNTVNLRNGLEIAMVVLIVVLVIIGLIVGFSRLRKDGEEDQTYY